jgi:amino acid adenylation domain-containing protein/thioester reductase-like protein
MTNLKKIDNKKYVLDLFKNLSRQKEIPVLIQSNNQKNFAVMSFSAQKNEELYISMESIKTELVIGTELEIRFFYKEIFYTFQTQIIGLSESKATFQCPSTIFTSFKRLINRYKIEPHVEAYVCLNLPDQQFRLRDINTKGLSLISGAQLFCEGERIRNLFVKIADEIEIRADAEVKHSSINSVGQYVYGLIFVELEWTVYQRLFNYIFQKSYPDFKSLADFTMEELADLYDESRYISLKPKDDDDQSFMDLIASMEQLNYKPELASNLIYFKNGKLLTVGSVLRIYDRTFLGQQLLLAPGARLNPKAKTDIYIGLADFMLNHPYFEYYITYISNDLEWHQEIFGKINERIYDRDKFIYDQVCFYEYNLTEMDTLDIPDGYRIEALDDPAGFLSYTAENLPLLENQCYHYQLGSFYLDEIKQAYRAFGFNVHRKLWRVLRDETVVAYVVAEAFSEALNPFKVTDTCRIYSVNVNDNINRLLQATLPEVSGFFVTLHQKIFNVVISVLENRQSNIEIPGLKRKNTLGRVMASREGLSDYKKLMLAEFEYYTRYYPLTYPQKGIWYTEKLYPGTSIANIAATVRIKGNINYELLEKAINLFMERNEAVRLRIIEKDEEIMQYVAPYEYRHWDFYDFSKKELTELYQWEERQTLKPFDLYDCDLIYFGLIKLSDYEGGIYGKFHHTICDAWAMNLLVKQIMEFYSGLKQGTIIKRNKPPSYLDYIVREEEYKFAAKFEKDKQFWNNKFETVPELMNLKNRGSNYVSSKSMRKTVTISKQLGVKIREYCTNNKLSVFTLFMSTLFLYINRITSKDDIVIGTSVLNRSNPPEKEMIGMFISTIPIRFNLGSDLDFTTYIHNLAKEWTKLLKHQKYPYELMLKEFRERHKVSENLYDVMLSYQNARMFDDDTAKEYTGRWHPYCHQPESLNVHINDREEEGQYIINFDYLVELFDADEIERMHEHLINILKDAITNPGKKIWQLEILSEWEKRKLLDEFNDTEAEYPKEKTIHQLFEEQVIKGPNHIAVVFGENKLSYQELNQRSNRLARFLYNNGVNRNESVGIMIERSLEMVIAILGTLKAGGAILPIDPEYPRERIKYMLEDSNAKILLTQPHLLEKLSWKGTTFDIDNLELLPPGNEENLANVKNRANDLIYIIYTSGTTGKPKGVMIEHRNIVNLLNYQFTKTQINFGSKVLQYTTISFDVCYQEIFSTLLSGGELHLIDNEKRKNIEWLFNYIDAKQISIIFLPTSFLKFILKNKAYLEIFPQNVKHIITAGEQLIVTESFRDLLKKSNIYLHNHYGPSETHVVTTFTMNPGEDIPELPPIGKPISNTQIYILDKNMNLLPVGVSGELYISGANVGRGYVNKPDLTSEKFLPDPFQSGTQIYRTGDLARWLPDGNIEFLGRIDNQVKIRGYRVELGEIEGLLLNHQSIKEAVMVVKEEANGSNSLCAYIVTDRTLKFEQLQEYLSNELPDYMIPAYFIQLDKIPLTPNGKVDRNRLPEPAENVNLREMYIVPEGAAENKLADIWRKILYLDNVGTTNNFFELGGDSLKAIILASKIHKEFQVEIPIKKIFELKNIKELTKYILSNEKSSYLSIKPAAKREYYPVSSAQKRIYILQQFEGAGVSYNMPGAMLVEGTLNIKKFEEVFRALIQRHEALRTSFEMKNEQPVQIIHEKVNFNIPIMKATKIKLSSIINEFIQPFDLSNAPLFRIKLVRFEESRYLFLFDMHHIISDGISIKILIDELTIIYEGKELPKLKLQYKDFSVWQNELLQTDFIKNQAKYWLDVYKDEIPILNLPTDYPRPLVQSFEGARIKFNLNKLLTQSLYRLASETNTSLYMILLASYNILLSRYSSQDDIIIGSPVVGRRHADLENIFGIFINTLALRSRLAGNKTFQDFLQSTKENVLKALDNQDYPFEELVTQLGINRDTERNALFDTMFALRNISIAKIKIGDFFLLPYNFPNKIAKFDITLEVIENPDKINLEVEYCTKLYKKATIERMSRHFLNIVTEVVVNPELKISALEILTGAEKEQLLAEFNDTKTDYPKNFTIHTLLEEQVKKTPDKIAIIFEDQTLTYSELNRNANKLAKAIRQKGIKPDCIIGIIAERSLDTIIGIIGILKAGGAYLPIDPETPWDRNIKIINDSDPVLLLTSKNVLSKYSITGDRINQFSQRILFLDELAAQANDNGFENIGSINSPTDLAYVIYTSGSTGNPKGVMVEHRNVIRLVKNTNFITFLENDRILQTGTLVFDAATFEIWGSLLNGLTLVLVDKNMILDAKQLAITITKYKITTLWLTAPLFNQLSQENPEMFQGVRTLLVGGDVLSTKHIYRVKEACDNINIINGYGPTENTTFSTYYLVDKYHPENIPIGKPINNSTVYILDSNLKLQPIGVPGILYVGGDGVARGYLNQDNLTAEKFIENPFIHGERIYNTGDYAKWLSDGNIEFLGRKDNQVKIRGYRVELGEIENQLLKHPAIVEAVVIDRKDNDDKYLCAYFVSKEAIKTNDLSDFLLNKLPNYMIPFYFIKLGKIPLTLNGKIDREKLPEPIRYLAFDKEYIAPEGETETKLTQIWEEVLRCEKISSISDFFALGGDSLKAIILASKITKEFKVEVPLHKIFELKNIKDLSKYLSAQGKSVYSSIKPVPKQEYYPLSSAQKRIYILQQFKNAGINYNVPGVMIIEGVINKQKLEDAFKVFIKRHEVFRTSFDLIDEQPIQKIHENVNFTIFYEEINENRVPEIINKFIQPFDLSKAPLLRVKLIRINEIRHILLFDIHHIISDGTSINIMIKELAELYEDKELPQLTIQYKDFAVWQNELFKTDFLKKQEKYWLDLYHDDIPILNMPMDYPRPLVQSFEGHRVKFHINKDLAQALFKLSTSTHTSLFMVLLASYNILLSKYTSQEDIVVGSPVVGRRHNDLERICGMFVNTLPLRNHCEGDKTFHEFLQSVRENVLKALENQDYPFEELVSHLEINRDIGRNALFDIMFTLQNTFTSKIKIGDLKIYPYDYQYKIAKFDLTLEAIENSGEINLEFEYNMKLYRKETIDRMTQHFLNIIKQVTLNPELQIFSIDMLAEVEKNQLLYEFNDTKANYPKEKTIHELFEEQVEKTPDKVVVVYNDQQLTYRELNNKANQLAGMLREKGVKPESIVGIMVVQSIDMFIGILGIIKAGGAFLPIDSQYPSDRINYMLKDSNTRILLTQSNLVKYIKWNCEIISIDVQSRYPIRRSYFDNLLNVNTSQNLIYIIYTSGSSGKPKGTLIEHKSLVNLVMWHIKRFSITANDRCTKYANFSFDASVWEIFPYIVVGATIYIIPDEIKFDIYALNDFFIDNNITVSFLPTQVCEQFMNLENSSLRLLLTGGDKLNSFIKRKYDLVNNYGPTENTVVSTSFLVNKNYNNIPIGRPIANLKIYIFDKYNNLQPIGIPGELCISGDGLARGYLNNPELTRDKFIQNPFNSNEKIYKTGDLARWLSDGNIEFLGRIDQQIKIHGYRIELGEIESRLLNHRLIKEAVVINIADNLYAYVVPKGELKIAQIKKYLSTKLPKYMIPAYYIKCNKIPLTANGKIDKNTLLKYKAKIKGKYKKPQNKVQTELVKKWQEILGIEKIGINDNFFKLGGNSLVIIRVLSSLKKYHWNLTLQDFFTYQTIKELSDKINKKKSLSTKADGVDISKRYLCDDVKNIRISAEKVEFGNVLLTGATGYLGIHLLNEIIQKTNANIYCLIRAENLALAGQKLQNRFDFYLSKEYNEIINKRVFIINGAITLPNFGLSRNEYLKLDKKVDLVIHAAALTKHYGHYVDFSNVNVSGTKEVLKFSSLNKKRLAYISTLSISGNNLLQREENLKLTENDFFIGQNYTGNAYIRSKFEAENLVHQAINSGLDSIIFRIGNLTERYIDGHFQININDNLFHNIIKSFIVIGAIPTGILLEEVEFTPVDYCSEAIIELAKIKDINGKIFHLYNHKTIKVVDILEIFNSIGIKITILSNTDFQKHITDMFNTNDKEKQDVFHFVNTEYNYKRASDKRYKVQIDSLITREYLKRIDFSWPEINSEYLIKIVKYLNNIGYLPLPVLSNISD